MPEKTVKIELPLNVARNLFDFLGNMSSYDVRCVLLGRQSYVPSELVTETHNSNFFVWKQLLEALKERATDQ